MISAPPQEKSGVAEPDQSSSDMGAPQPVYRKDYKPTPYLIDQVHLTFQLGEDSTKVVSELSCTANYKGSSPPEMVLNGTLACL